MDKTDLTLNKPAQKEMTQPISQPAKQEPAVKHKILIVDDDDEVRSLLVSQLEKSSFKVIEASTGQQALKLATSKNVKLQPKLTHQLQRKLTHPEVLSFTTFPLACKA